MGIDSSAELELGRVLDDLSSLIDFLSFIALIDRRMEPQEVRNREETIEALRLMAKVSRQLVAVIEALAPFRGRLSPSVDRQIDGTTGDHVSAGTMVSLAYLSDYTVLGEELLDLDMEAVNERLEWLTNTRLKSLALRIETCAEDLNELLA
jgi:hypothetical protein